MNARNKIGPSRTPNFLHMNCHHKDMLACKVHRKMLRLRKTEEKKEPEICKFYCLELTVEIICGCVSNLQFVTMFYKHFWTKKAHLFWVIYHNYGENHL